MWVCAFANPLFLIRDIFRDSSCGTPATAARNDGVYVPFWLWKLFSSSSCFCAWTHFLVQICILWKFGKCCETDRIKYDLMLYISKGKMLQSRKKDTVRKSCKLCKLYWLKTRQSSLLCVKRQVLQCLWFHYFQYFLRL